MALGCFMINASLEVTRMSEHEVLALDANYETWKRERASGISVEPFLYYSVEQITKRFNLTDEQIQYGITDHANDGGIDAIYCLAGNSNILIKDDAKANFANIDSIRVLVFQVKSSKSETGFKPDDIDKFAHFTDVLLNLSHATANLSQLYQSKILLMIDTFQAVLRSAAHNFPPIRVDFYYVTRGDGELLSVAAREAEDRLRSAFRRHRGNANTSDSISLAPTDSCSLLTYVRQRRQKTRQIRWATQPIPIGKGYLGIVKLTDYFNFLKTEMASLDELIFESNVRGSQGNTSVNRQMKAALDEGGPPDFWQLNNGVTVTCAKINPIDAFNLAIEDAQVVNGLQTSRQIFAHFTGPRSNPNDERMVVLKLILVSDDAVRDKIIRATNNQNPIKASTLILTGEVHRDIEDLFKKQGYFYDRRPGFYKDQGKEISKIVSLNEVTQAAISILLHRPDDARGRPGNYLGTDAKKKGEKHKQLFKPRAKNKSAELNSYLKAVLIVRVVDEFLRGIFGLDPGERRNMLFHVSYHLVCSVSGTPLPTVENVFEIKRSDITTQQMQASYDIVNEAYRRLSQQTDNPDMVAKGADFLAEIKKTIPLPDSTREKKTSLEPKMKIRDVLKGLEFDW